MTLSKLKPTEQLLLAVVIVALTVGAYAYFRFIPKNKAIALTELQVSKTERKLLKARIPVEPIENVDDLLKELDDQEKALELTKSMADEINQRLAPFDSQELKVRISELARNSGVRIRTNERFIPLAKTPINKKAKKKKVPVKPPVNQSDLILPMNRSWIDRVSQQTMFHRPLQRLILEGNYHSIRAFVHGLDKLQWQVTIMRLDIETMPISPILGYPQLLTAEFVLAL